MNIIKIGSQSFLVPMILGIVGRNPEELAEDLKTAFTSHELPSYLEEIFNMGRSIEMGEDINFGANVPTFEDHVPEFGLDEEALREFGHAEVISEALILPGDDSSSEITGGPEDSIEIDESPNEVSLDLEKLCLLYAGVPPPLAAAYSRIRFKPDIWIVTGNGRARLMLLPDASWNSATLLNNLRGDEDVTMMFSVEKEHRTALTGLLRAEAAESGWGGHPKHFYFWERR